MQMIELDAQTRLVVPRGKLRGSRAKALGQQLERLLDAGVQRLILDLREVHSLDSLGTWAISNCLDRGAEVVTVGARGAIDDTLEELEVTHPISQLTRASNMEQALVTTILL